MYGVQSDHFDFLQVNIVTVNQVYIVLHKYGVIKELPISVLSKDVAKKKAKT